MSVTVLPAKGFVTWFSQFCDPGTPAKQQSQVQGLPVDYILFITHQ